MSRSNSLLEQFAYGAAHDLKAPIRKIIFCTDWLKVSSTSKLDDKEIKSLTKVEHFASHMNILVDDLISFCRVSLDQNETAVVIDLNDIFKLVIEDLDQEVQDSNAMVTCAFLPEIKSNSRQLQQVFNNLLINSLKYHQPEKIPRIDIECSIVDIADLADLVVIFICQIYLSKPAAYSTAYFVL